MTISTKKFVCEFLSVFVLLVFASTQAPTLTLAAVNAESAPSVFEFQQESDNEEDGDRNPESQGKKRKKTRFANWHSWVNWMFSPGKWLPVLDYLERLYGNMLEIEQHAIPVPDHSF